MPADTFSGHPLGTDGPYTRGEAVTPSDSVDLGFVCNALIAFTTAGTASVILSGGDTVSIYLPLGSPVRVRATRVRLTGTSAAGITALR